VHNCPADGLPLGKQRFVAPGVYAGLHKKKALLAERLDFLFL